MAFASASRQFPNDCLPPEDEYSSRESLHAAINAWAISRGYACVTGKSRKTCSGKRIVVFSCDRGGVAPKTSVSRRRLTTSRRTGCQFSVLAKESLDNKTWQLSYRSGSEHTLHNHEPSTDISAHPVHRQNQQLVSQRLQQQGRLPICEPVSIAECYSLSSKRGG